MVYFSILIADHAETLRALIKNSFSSKCHDVHIDEAGNLAEVQQKLRNHAYDLILGNESFEIDSQTLLLWIETLPSLRFRCYKKAATENFSRFIPPAHLTAPVTLPIKSYWMIHATEKSEKRLHTRIDTHEPIFYQAGNVFVLGEMVNIALGGILGMFERRKDLPLIAEKLSLSIGPPETPKVHNITGFPVRIQTLTPVLECRHIQLAVKFYDLTKSQQDHLAQFVASQPKPT